MPESSGRASASRWRGAGALRSIQRMATAPAMSEALDQLEAEAKSLKGKLTLGTISVICALGYLDFRFGTYDWRGRCPKLGKWFATVSKLPSVKATVPPPA